MKRMFNQVSQTLLIMRRNFLRTMLTSLGIVISTVIFVFGILITTGITEKKHYYYNDFPKDSILIESTNEKMTNNIIDLYDGEAKAINCNTYEGELKLLTKDIEITLVGVDENFLSFPLRGEGRKDTLEIADLIAGRSFLKEERELGINSIIINESYAKMLFGEETTIGRKVKISEEVFSVVGVISDTKTVVENMKNINTGKKEMNFSVFCLNSALKKHNFRESTSFTIVRFSNENFYDNLEGLSKYLDRKIYDYQSIKNKIDDDNYGGKMTVMSISIIISVFSLLVITIVMTFNAKEKISEVGIRRTFGAKRDDIFFSFIIESLFYGVVGSFVGILISLLGYMIVYLVFYAIGEFIIFNIPLWIILLPIAASIGITTIAGIVPAISSIKMDIVECLKVE